MKIDFRLAKSDERNTLLELMREFYDVEHLVFDESVARRALEQMLADSTYGVAHLIYIDDALAGYVVLTFGYSLEFHGRDALVDELYVRESYRGKGAGAAALLYVEEYCAREQIAALHLEVDYANTRAQKLYDRVGYKDHGRRLMTKWIGERRN